MTALKDRKTHGPMIHDSLGRPLYAVCPESGCWIWQLSLLGNGYGQYRHTTAHRWVYQYYNGPIPSELHLDHLCRNRRCVNPEHLEVVTPKTNNRRQPRVVLDAAKVAEILAAIALDEPQKDIAARHGVSRATVHLISRGRIWDSPLNTLGRRGWLKTGMTASRIRRAKKLRAAGASYGMLAAKFSIDRSTAWRLTQEVE